MLTPKQEKFCLMYAQGKSAREAYAIAYERENDMTAKSCGNRLLTKAEIQEKVGEFRLSAFEQGRRKAAKKLAEKAHSEAMVNDMAEELAEGIATATEVASFLTGVMRGEAKEGEEPPAMRDRLKAAEMLGKNLGMFVDRVDVNDHRLDVNIQVVD